MRSFLTRHAEFLRNVAVLMSGKTLAAIIALGTVPIVARLFSPSDFGTAAIFVSTVGMLSTIATLRYGSAIVLPESNITARGIFRLTHRIAILYSLLTLLIISILDVFQVRVGTLDLLGVWKWLVPFGIWLTAFVGIQESWLTRMKNFKIFSTSLVVGNSISSGVRIGLGAIYGSFVGGLVIGELCGKVGRLLVQRKICSLSIAALVAKQPFKYSKLLAQRYSDFPIFNAPAGLVFSLGQNLPVILFGTLFGPAVAGFYAMASRVSRVPISIVATSMRRVFLQKAAEITNDKRSLLKAFSLSLATLSVIGLVPLIAIALYGQQLLGWVLGNDWLEAGKYLEVIAPWLFSIWVTVPCNPVFVVLRRQKFWLIMTSTLTSLRLAAFGIAHAMSYDSIETLELFVVATITGHAITIGTTVFMIRKSATEKNH